MDFLPSLFLLDLSSSFSPSFPSGYLVSFVCLLGQGSRFLSAQACVLLRLSFLQFCHRLLRSVTFILCLFATGIYIQFLSLFSACFGFQGVSLPLVFRQVARGVIFGDFLSCSVPIKRKCMWSFVLSHRSVASDCRLHSRVSFFNCFKHFNIVPKHEKYLPMPLMQFGKSSHCQAGKKHIYVIWK